VIASIVVAAACGPALPDDPGHPASPRAAQARVPALATALTADPAPPPEELDEAARTFSSDGDEGVRPPVFGIAVHEPGTPLPSRDTRPVEDAEHERRAHEHTEAEHDAGEHERSRSDGAAH
jgi:hypothetical protein